MLEEVIELQSVDPRVAYLGDANLQGAILGRSMLAEADLSRADLSDVNLRGANARSAPLAAVTAPLPKLIVRARFPSPGSHR